MAIKSKTILIKDGINISRLVLTKEINKLNADVVIVSSVANNLDDIPIGFEIELSKPIEENVNNILRYWKKYDNGHLLMSEYARKILNNKIKIVEGFSLYIPWFYNLIKNMHKNSNQTIIEIYVNALKNKELKFIIDEQEYTKEEIVERINVWTI